ncbi:MAG TPA: hypothetical protein PK509_08550 [Catalimonadaceae bacterium]|nr:hypothetical protein [Catalimonadaceae bacterium]HPI11075.1 hypothetical protein [Catalimonadaceae bacterium]
MAFERKSDKLLSKNQFYLRLSLHLTVALGLVVISIGFGAIGYHGFEGISWVDSIYNASMILTGMGPVTVLKKDITKIFASLYAIYGGIILLAITGIILAPLAHRLLHLFHLREAEEE